MGLGNISLFFRLCLQANFPVVFPTIPDSVSRPYSRSITLLCSRPISRLHSRPVPWSRGVPSHQEIV